LRYVPIRYSDWEKRQANRPLFVYTTKLIMANEPYAVKDPSVLFMPLSGTFTMKGKELEKIISDARVKFIMGQLDEAGFKAEVERWKKQGGNDIIKELSAEYAKSQGK
jgi:putative aldouronate transport system substrate-binding protein